jgi:hypothetical protein
MISTISGLHQVPLGIAETSPSQQPIELAYDDGNAETGWVKKPSGIGGYDAVRFSSTLESFQVLTARYYIRSSPANFNVLILDANRRLVYDKPVTPTTEGWFEIDLSKESIVLDGDFYVAMKWTIAEKPELGADETKPDGRSFFVDADGTWQTYAEVNKAVTKSKKDGDFMIRASIDRPKAKITLRVQPNIIGVTVDGVPYSTDRLPTTFMWDTESSHTLLVDPTTSGPAGVRYVFMEWSDGSKDTSRTITATGSVDLTARFKTQYELKATSDIGDPQGSGWYDARSIATFSVASPQPEAGLFGSLGGKIVFKAWTGDSTADTAAASITMDGPKAVQAEWTTDESQPYMILGGIGAAIVVVVIAILLFIRHRSAAPIPPPIIPTRRAAAPHQPAVAEPRFCTNCGSPMLYMEEHHRYYCNNCQQYA